MRQRVRDISTIQLNTQTGRSDGLLAQVVLAVAAWIYLCWLHWGNDGIWFFDATQHAAHGLFWKDFLANFTLEPREYVMSYFARYPVIRPTRYPPALYVLMAAVYGLFGASPHHAKGLVLSFTLMAALYTIAWCRRWFSKEAGWAGALIVLLPIVVKWSHAVMLNVPVLALSIAALYHYRRWLESPPDSPNWRQLYIGAALAVASILTHLTNCVIVLVFIAWLLTERRWRWLFKWKTLTVAAASAMTLLPWFLVVMTYERNRAAAVSGSGTWLTDPSRWHWLYYLKHAPSLFGWHILALTIVGVVAGLLVYRWRRETLRVLVLTLTYYLFFSYMRWPDVRYIIVLSFPLAVYSTLALVATVQCAARTVKRVPATPKPAMAVVVLMLFVGQAWTASRVRVPSITGYGALVTYLEQVAPNEPIFYDGRRDDIVSAYLLLGDPNYQRRAVCGNRLLYARGGSQGSEQYVSSPQDVIDLLEGKGGCRWIAVDEVSRSDYAATQYLRTAVQGPNFEWVRSFPIKRTWWGAGHDTTRVDVYRFLRPVAPVQDVTIPYVSQGKIVTQRVRPIER